VSHDSLLLPPAAPLPTLGMLSHGTCAELARSFLCRRPEVADVDVKDALRALGGAEPCALPFHMKLALLGALVDGGHFHLGRRALFFMA